MLPLVLPEKRERVPQAEAWGEQTYLHVATSQMRNTGFYSCFHNRWLVSRWLVLQDVHPRKASTIPHVQPMSRGLEDANDGVDPSNP